jgi:proteasome lid subunit RPN8/RPN11
MPDPILNLQASALTERVDTYLHRWPEKRCNGIGSYCIRNPRTGSLTWHTEPLTETIIKKYNLRGVCWQIRILGPVWEKIRALRSNRLPNETGGAVIGRIDSATHTVYVTGVGSAPENAKSSPANFDIDFKYLHEQDENALILTNQTLKVLGTWHSHIGSSAPSHTDKVTFEKLKSQLKLPFPIMLIASSHDLEIVNG